MDGSWKIAAGGVKELVWPASLSGKSGRILGGLSLVALLSYGFEHGFGPVFSIILDYYEKLLLALFGRAEPFINGWLSQLSQYFGWPMKLHPHWKHIFVLLGIYFFREVGVAIQHVGRWKVIFQAIVGFLVASASSIAAGAISAASDDNVANFLICAIPVVGAAFYAVIGNVWDATFLRHQWAVDRHRPPPTWWGYYRYQLWRIGTRSLVALLLLWAGLNLYFIRQLPSPGLAIFALLILAFGFYWVIDGVWDSARLQKEGEPRIAAYFRSRHTQLGIAILGTFFWVSVFLLTNAGLGFFGL